MGGPPVDPALCFAALGLPILAPCLYHLYLRLRMRHLTKARHLHPLHLKAACSMAASSALNVPVCAVCLFSPILLVPVCIPFYVVPAMIFAVLAGYHWYEHNWFQGESQRVG